MNMSDQDKETIELMIENKLNEKLIPMDKKIDKILNTMESFSDRQTNMEARQDKSDNKITEVAEQTAVWRWLQRKPKRFALVLGIMWLLSIYEIRTAVGGVIKEAAEFLKIFS